MTPAPKKLVIVGGGGFRTPLIHRALLRRPGPPLIGEIVLHDIDADRLATIAAVMSGVSQAEGGGPQVTTTTSIDTALDGADFVFVAVRVGGLEGRVCDERVAIDLGVLGQETTGAGGVAFGLRTVPVMIDLAERIKRRAPHAWTINFTNPAGLITQAMRSVLGERVIGICDSPMGLARRARRAMELPDSPTGDYAGLNHLGWLHSLIDDDGVDRLPELLALPDRLATIEEGRIFGPDWLATLGAIPNEYLYYYYFTREAVAATTESTRAEFLLEQQTAFFAALSGGAGGAAGSAGPPGALGARAEWDRVRTERNATYMAAARTDADGRTEARSVDDIEHGGYEDVAVAVMEALGGRGPASLILNVANRGAIAGLADEAVVEVPCVVNPDGATPESPGGAVHTLPGSELGLVQQVKAVEELVIAAAFDRSPTLALAAFALHPLVDSVTVARRLLAGYRAAIPSLDRVFASA